MLCKLYKQLIMLRAPNISIYVASKELVVRGMPKLLCILLHYNVCASDFYHPPNSWGGITVPQHLVGMI